MHRLRMEYMERQLASLTGLVQKALTTGPPNKNQQPTPQQLQQIPTRDCDLTKDRSSASKYYYCIFNLFLLSITHKGILFSFDVKINVALNVY